VFNYRWWKELGLGNDLTFARDEPIKWYMWSMACLPDPRFSEARIEITKPLSLAYIIDDMFDFCANIDELTLFTEAVKRYYTSYSFLFFRICCHTPFSW